MTQEFQENTVAIILNEMFNDSNKLKTQMQFDALIEKYAERIVKLFFIPDVKVRFSDIDKIAWEKIEQEYEQEDFESNDEIMQGEITTALEWYKQGIRDVLNAL